MAKRISLPESELDSAVLTGGQTEPATCKKGGWEGSECAQQERVGDLTSRVNEIQPSAHILRGVYLGPGRCGGCAYLSANIAVKCHHCVL